MLLPQRTIKTWIRRESLLKPQDKDFLENHDLYLGDCQKAALKLTEPEPVYRALDIGCGDCQSSLDLHQWLTATRQQDAFQILAAEPHTPGILKGLRSATERKIANIFFYHGDILDLVEMLPSQPLFDCVHIYFSDPWQKKRHHKRRLIQVSFLKLLWGLLKNHGHLHIATDWAPYAQEIQEKCLAVEEYYDLSRTVLESYFQRVPTKYERRALAAGRKIEEFVLSKKVASSERIS